MQYHDSVDYGDQWLAHLRQINHPLIMEKDNHMQDHAYETRQMYIKDYAARVKLAPNEQRALWFSHLEAIKHPRLEPQPRRNPFKGLAEIKARARETSRQEEHDRAIRAALANAAQEAEKDRVMREAWNASQL